MKRKISGLLVFFWTVALLIISHAVLGDNKTPQPESKLILGWVEFVRLEPWGMKMRARIDTGANTSSMSARDINQFKKGSEDWVKFVLDFKVDKGKPNRSVEIERPIVRIVKIKQHQDILQERLVVNMDICIANQVHNIEFNLIDRRGLNYPVLLGRRALESLALVDPARTFIEKADCGHVKKKKKKVDTPPGSTNLE
ncbi:MAG: ATP-dependent zinc protease [Nitrosomonas sp.]|nr:ATP-dependent zinc protease [Nitrosomonas sp.]MBK7363514.1 ATP-dependent zinc protease [Nitrosomonas sp.]